MATSGSFEFSWQGGNWGSSAGYYHCAGTWTRTSSGISLTGITFWQTCPAGGAYGTMTDTGVHVNNGTGYTTRLTMQDGYTTNRVSLANGSISLSTSATSTTIYCYVDGEYTGSQSISFDAWSTPPTGLQLSNVTRLVDGFSATISVSGWGTGGTTANSYLEFSVCESSGSTQNRVWNIHTGRDTSAVITATNTQYTTKRITINPNTTYYLTMYATNGAVGAGNSDFSGYTTLPPAPTNITVSGITTDSATLTWNISADGGVFTKTYKISYDGGTTWQTIGTHASGSATTMSASLTGLSPATQYNALLKAETNAGSSATTSFQFRTLSPIYGSVNGQTKIAKKIYGSVNGQTKLVKHVYGSVNGQTKKIF